MKQVHNGFNCGRERYAEKLRSSTAGGVPAGNATERHLFLGGARQKGSALAAQELEKWVASQLADEAAVLKERRKGREERELVAPASDAGSWTERKPKRRSCLEAVAPFGHGFFGPAASNPDLLPLPTGVGFLPGFEHIREKEWLRSSVGVINELEGREGLAPRNSYVGATACACQCCHRVLFTARVPCGRDARGRDLQARLGLVAARTSWIGPFEFCGAS